MNQARVTNVPADAYEARAFLNQARAFVGDASVRGLRGTSRQLLLYQGVIAACDAALLRAGYRIEGVDGGHALRLEKTVAVVGLDDDLLDALNDARQVRAGSAYAAGLVVDEDVAATSEAAEQLLKAVSEFIDIPDPRDL